MGLWLGVVVVLLVYVSAGAAEIASTPGVAPLAVQVQLVGDSLAPLTV